LSVTSVTYLSSLSDISRLFVPASLSNDPYTDHVPFIVEYSLQGIPRLVPHQADVPALFVHVLSLHRQTVDVTNHFFTHYLAVFVQGDLDDVPGLVHRALHGLARSVGALAGQHIGLGLVSFGNCLLLSSLACAFSIALIGGLACHILDLIHTLIGCVLGSLRCFVRLSRSLPGGVACALGHLTCRVSDSLGCLARALGGLPRTFSSRLGRLSRALSGCLRGLPGTGSSLLGGLSGAFPNLTRSLSGSLSDFAGGLPRAFTNLARGLARAFTDLLSCLTGTFSHIFDRRLSPGANILHGLTGALHRLASAGPHVFHGFARALDGFSGTFANVFDRRASARSNILHGGTRASAHVFDGGARPRADVGDSLIGSLAHQVARARANIFHRGACALAHVFHR